MKGRLVISKKDVLDFLAKGKLMALATYGTHPWIASVYYAYDKNLNIYFITSPMTLHGRQMTKNPLVSAAIADSHQNLSDLKRGLQVYGHVEQVSGIYNVRRAIKLWKNFLNAQRPDITAENMEKGIYKGRIWRLTPKKIKVFDQEKFKAIDGEAAILDLT
ncbi:MAG TPA: pyridoxamine 5'-phosphate oxidase family protein [Patescibacteria group bacterium]|nr:pyridoxamine 5'-phosphate oxidase family protein [Patescibacteria group bacterium]